MSLLVNVAGGGVGGGRTVSRDGTPHDKDSFVKTMEMNAVGTFNMSRLVAAAMAANEPDEEGERGVIVNTASIAGIEGQTGQLAYGAAKAAILGMSLPMARDLAPVGIRVSAIAPGTMGTPIMMSVPEQMRANLEKDIVFPKRMGEPVGVRSPRRVDRAQPVPERREHPARRSAAVPTEMSTADLLRLLSVEPDGERRYISAAVADSPRPVVEGSHLLAQTIVAAGQRGARASRGDGHDAVPQSRRCDRRVPPRALRAVLGPYVHIACGTCTAARSVVRHRAPAARRRGTRRHPSRRRST